MDAGEIEFQRIRDKDETGPVVADRLVLFGDVGRELFLSASLLIRAAATATIARSVSDKSHVLFRADVETAAFGWTRHFSLISSIACNVV